MPPTLGLAESHPVELKLSETDELTATLSSLLLKTFPEKQFQ
jgi:hypothetical protein